MNQLINSLVDKTAAMVPGVYTVEYESGKKGVEFNEEALNKFAELIVRECVKEIEFQYGGGSDQPMDNEWDRAIECVSSMVKYRFGVEE